MHRRQICQIRQIALCANVRVCAENDLQWSDCDAVFSGMEIMVSSMHTLVYTITITLLALRISWSLLVHPCAQEADAGPLNVEPAWVQLDDSGLVVPDEVSTIARRQDPCFKHPLPCHCTPPLVSMMELGLGVARCANPIWPMLTIAAIQATWPMRLQRKASESRHLAWPHGTRHLPKLLELGLLIEGLGLVLLECLRRTLQRLPRRLWAPFCGVAGHLRRPGLVSSGQIHAVLSSNDS